MKRCPKCNLKYDDSLSFCLEDGSRLLRTNHPDSTLVLPAQTPAIPGDAVEIDDPVVAINIHEQFPYVQNARDLYNCTRGSWRMNPRRAGRAKYFFAVYQGVIKEVYDVHECIPVTLETKEYWRKRILSQGKGHVPPAVEEGRAEFLGQVASDDVRAKYVGRRVPVRMTQNPVRYFNC